MTTELWAALIGAVVLLLTNTAAAIKMWADIAKTKADRAEVGAKRDADSQTLHDMILKHDFAIATLKDNQALTATVVDDLRDTCSTLNTSVAKLDVNVGNLAEAIKELKK